MFQLYGIDFENRLQGNPRNQVRLKKRATVLILTFPPNIISLVLLNLPTPDWTFPVFRTPNPAFGPQTFLCLSVLGKPLCTTRMYFCALHVFQTMENFPFPNKRIHKYFITKSKFVWQRYCKMTNIKNSSHFLQLLDGIKQPCVIFNRNIVIQYLSEKTSFILNCYLIGPLMFFKCV